MDLQLSKYREALKNSTFPQPKRKLFGLISTHEPLYGLEEVEAQLRCVREELVSLCSFKDPCRQPFFDEVRARPIFILIDFGLAFALDFEDRTRRRRPSEHGRVGEMEDIMKAIVIFRQMIVRKPVAEQNSSGFLENEFLAVDFALIDIDAKQPRKLLVNMKPFIEQRREL